MTTEFVEGPFEVRADERLRIAELAEELAADQEAVAQSSEDAGNLWRAADFRCRAEALRDFAAELRRL